MISIIVCTYNRANYIYKTLEHIAKNDFPFDEYEILLIDNNCTDNTEAECKQFRANFPNVRYSYIKEEKQGLSYARNRGIAEAQGDCYLFLDDDAFIQVDYLKNLRLHLLENPEMQAFGGRIDPLYESGSEPEWMSPRLIPIMSAINKGNDIVEFSGNSYPIGANMGFRKSCIEQIGMFNVALGRTKKNMIGGEEKDIFKRMQTKNLKIFYLPNLCVQHVIPENRTTIDYVKRMAIGVGVSEKIRQANNKIGFACSLLLEAEKWIGTFVLSLYYAVQGKFSKAHALVIFRWNVSKGLISKINCYD